MRIKPLILLSLFLFYFGCKHQHDVLPVEDVLQRYQSQYAPDPRTAIFDLQATVINDSIVIAGETNIPEARTGLMGELKDIYPNLVDSIRILPGMDLGEDYRAVVNLSVANIRSEAGHSAELSTQATLGTPLNVLKKKGGWFLVQTPDQYLGWLDFGGLELMNEQLFQKWKQSEKVVYTETYGFALDSTGKHLSDLVAGNIMKKNSQNDTAYQVSFPDGRTGYVSLKEALPYQEWIAQLQLSQETLVATSRKMMGLPYLWGGTSYKGVDCSGFTKTVYFLNGLILPRDASQQVRTGKLVDDQKQWENLQPGDLLFFGRSATDSTRERVVHVGMWIGDNQYIHSSGRVMINSMDPNAANYDEYNDDRYLRTKRILGVENGKEVFEVAELY